MSNILWHVGTGWPLSCPDSTLPLKYWRTYDEEAASVHSRSFGDTADRWCRARQVRYRVRIRRLYKGWLDCRGRRRRGRADITWEALSVHGFRHEFRCDDRCFDKQTSRSCFEPLRPTIHRRHIQRDRRWRRHCGGSRRRSIAKRQRRHSTIERSESRCRAFSGGVWCHHTPEVANAVDTSAGQSLGARLDSTSLSFPLMDLAGNPATSAFTALPGTPITLA